MSTKRLAAWIDDIGIDAEIRTFDEPCSSVQEAARAVGADPADFVKSLCVIADGQLVVAVVGGTDRLDLERLAAHLEAETVRMARPEEVLEATGYPVGGVPPFGFDAPFVVDRAVLEEDAIWAGGGSDRALVRTRPSVVVDVNGAEVADLRERRRG